MTTTSTGPQAGSGPDGARSGSAAEQLLRCVIDSLEGRICILAGDGTLLGANRNWDQAIASLGLPDSTIGSDFFTLTTNLARPDDVTGLHATVRGVLDGGRQHDEVKLHWGWAGTEEFVVVRAHAVSGHDLAKAVVSIVDITRAMATQAELVRITEHAQLLALVAEHTDDAVVIQDAAGRIEWVNDAFCQLTGHSEQDAVGRRRMDLWRSGDGDPADGDPADGEIRAIAARIDRGLRVDVDLPAERTDGRAYWAHLKVQPVLVDGRIHRFVGVERDITERRRAEQQLRSTNQRVQALADEIAAEKAFLDRVLASIPHLVYWKTAARHHTPAPGDDAASPTEPAALTYSGVNRAFLGLRRIAASAEVLGRSEADLPVTDELSELLPALEAEVFATGRPHFDVRVLLHQGADERHELLLSVLPYGERGPLLVPTRVDPPRQEVSGVIGVAADITQLSELERQLAQASRLESIGQLAAGIAHEINTPVQYVSDNTRFVADGVGRVLDALREVNRVLSQTAGTVGSAEEQVEAARRAVALADMDFLASEIPCALSQSQEGLQRVAEIVKAMKDYSHPGSRRAGADLNRAVESTVKVCRNEWKYVADLQLDLDPALPAVPCFEGELKQVLLNIIINAAHAIGQQRSGTGATGLGTIRVSTALHVDQVQVVVADDGPGMPEHVRRRVFDPFFTTKSVGKGTGQGLSMAYAVIVKKHAGRLDVESGPGQGARFTISLPLTIPEGG